MNSAIKPFFQGVRAATIFGIVVAPFATIFGIVAASLGLTDVQTFAFSAIVVAGASQIASLNLLSEGAPIFIAVLTGAILNLRMMMYSAALAPSFQGLPTRTRLMLAYSLVDQCFVLSQNKFEKEPDLTPLARAQYYFGVGVIIIGIWFMASMLGYYFGSLIPPQFDISFALPLAFIALIAPSLRTVPHIVAAFISAIGTIALNGIPYNLGLLVAGLIAIVTAAWLETYLERQNDK